MNDRSLVALHQAARMPVVTPTQVGRWRLKNFTVTPSEHQHEVLSIQTRVTSQVRADMEIARLVPPGDYVSLQRLMTRRERIEHLEEGLGGSLEAHAHTFGTEPDTILNSAMPESESWIPVMSDTPAEITEHEDALRYATGRVLITGLGLGCLPRALCSLEDVERIDIIEIDPEVIEIMSPYLTDPRIHIHRGDARDPTQFFPPETEFTYCWHDIWTQISADNLTDAKAEHGLSFGTLKGRYAALYTVGRQACWSEPDALKMKAIQDRELAEELEFQERLMAAPLDEQVDMVMEKAVTSKLGLLGLGGVPEGTIDVMDPEGKLRAHIRRQLQDPHVFDKFRASAAAAEDYVGERPNAHLEKADG